jgi:hypothetical protein
MWSSSDNLQACSTAGFERELRPSIMILDQVIQSNTAEGMMLRRANNDAAENDVSEGKYCREGAQCGGRNTIVENGTANGDAADNVEYNAAENDGKGSTMQGTRIIPERKIF